MKVYLALTAHAIFINDKVAGILNIQLRIMQPLNSVTIVVRGPTKK